MFLLPAAEHCRIFLHLILSGTDIAKRTSKAGTVMPLETHGGLAVALRTIGAGAAELHLKLFLCRGFVTAAGQ